MKIESKIEGGNSIVNIEENKYFETDEAVHHISQIENPILVNRPIRIEGIVSSTSLSYLAPCELRATWMDGKSGELKEKEYVFNIFSPELLKFVAVTDKTKQAILSKIMGVPKFAKIYEGSHFVIYKLRLRPPIFYLITRDDSLEDEKGREYKAFDVYIVTNEKLDLPPSTRLILEGWIRPDPKTQRSTFMAIEVSFPESVESFDREAILSLGSKLDDKTTRHRVDWILENFERYSHIVGRRNLAYAGFLAFFTPVWIELDEDIQRGWGIILIIGDTTTGKSEVVRKLIILLKAGTLITAETTTTVGLTAAAVKADRGEWFTDFGFLVLNDRRLLAIDGYQKLSTYAQSELAEAERQGVVTKGAAAKGSAPARTRQIKIANPIDFTGKYSTKSVKEFYYPILTIPTVFDKTIIARLDMAVISNAASVDIESINTIMGSSYDPDLTLFSELMKWAWSGYSEIEYEDGVVEYILGEATRFHRKFYSNDIPLVGNDFKYKLARLSISLARLTLSTTPDLRRVKVTKEHVNEIIAFLEGEYLEAGLHTVASSENLEIPNEEDVKLLLCEFENLGIDNKRAVEILRFIVLKGTFTRDVLRTEFNLTDKNQLRPMIAILRSRELIKVGRGYYPTSKLIQLVKLIENIDDIHFKDGKIGNLGKKPAKNHRDTTLAQFTSLKKDDPSQNPRFNLREKRSSKVE